MREHPIVYLYPGNLKLVEKSGVGQAIYHQKAMLESVQVPVVTRADADYDIIHINTIFPDSLLAAKAAKRKGKKVIWYGHSTKEDFRNSFVGSNQMAEGFEKWIRFCYGQADLVITPSEYAKELLDGYGIGKPVRVLSNGVDTRRFHPSEQARQRFRSRYGVEAGEKTVLSVGHYISRKGIVEFIELARSLPQYRFFWFGHTDKKLIPREISDAIEHAPDNLSFPGQVSQNELRDAYCGCDLFAFLSKEETEGIVILEALACGIPVLVRDIPVYESWLSDGCQVRKADSEEAFRILACSMLEQSPGTDPEAVRTLIRNRSIHGLGMKLLEYYQTL